MSKTILIGKDGRYRGTMVFATHYKIMALENMTQVYQIMPNPDDESVEWMYAYNWLFIGTSGVHGTYTTLDDIEENWDYIENYKGDPADAEHTNLITVLILHPRTCVLKYGHLEVVRRGDIPYLRKCVAKTIKAILESQEGNLPKPD